MRFSALYISLAASKIHAMSIKKFEIVIVLFKGVDKKRNSQLFKKMFLLANLNIDVVLGILFLILSYI